MTRRRTTLFAAFQVAALATMALMPTVASAKGQSFISFPTAPVAQYGLYNPNPPNPTPNAGFFDVKVSNAGGSHLTHEVLRVYLPGTFVPLAALSFNGTAVGPYAGCGIQSRGNPVNVSLPAFVCSWDENWAPGFEKATITFAVGGTAVGDFLNGITVTLSPAAKPPLDTKFVTVGVNAASAGHTTLFTGPTDAPTVLQTSGAGQQDQLKLPANQFYLADVGDTAGTLTCGTTTPGGQFGNLVTAHVNKGQSVSPYIEWTLTITLSQVGHWGRVSEPGPSYIPTYDTTGLVVYHCTDAGVLDIIQQSPACGTPTLTAGCMVSLTHVTTENELRIEANETYTTTLTFVFQTLTNGLARAGG